MALQTVSFKSRRLERFAGVIDDEQYAALERAAAEGRAALGDRALWCINSTARGGGVAEMLVPMLGYCQGQGVDARWAVIEGDPEFFAVTKRLHHRLHGMAGDGGPLGARERAVFDRVQEANAAGLHELVRPGDVVLLHDPQVAGLGQTLLDMGCPVVWRAHIGSDVDNELVREGWAFLEPFVAPATAYVFSRREYVWEVLDPARAHVIAPSIDAFSPKNQDLDPATCQAILHTAGITDGRPAAAPAFLRSDDTPAQVGLRARMVEDEQLPADAPLILQVSRWDPLKDPVGVMEGFVAAADELGDAHLMLAGPDVSAVTDDPEGAQVLAAVQERREQLAPDLRRRVHLAQLPMDDVEENAAIVNALQRRASIVVQKSIAEGFGLTVAEALWKARPMVGSRVGGIRDQIQHGETGLLLDDPHDAAALGAALARLTAEPETASALGAAGQELVRRRFLESRHLLEWVALLGVLLGPA